MKELCDDQKKLAEAFSELALRLKAAGPGNLNASFTLLQCSAYSRRWKS